MQHKGSVLLLVRDCVCGTRVNTHLRAVCPRNPKEPSQARPLTRLEDQGACNIHISTVTRGLDALIGAHERANDERSSLADAVEGAELDAHGGRAVEKERAEKRTSERCQGVVRGSEENSVTVVGLNARDFARGKCRRCGFGALSTQRQHRCHKK